MKRFLLLLLFVLGCTPPAAEEQKVDEAVNEEVVSTLPDSPQTGDRAVLKVAGVEFAFRWCPPGEFMMGSPPGELWQGVDETQHKVKLTRGFWLLETEVTQAMWQAVMGNNPSKYKDERNPVENVSWNVSQEFCQKLSQKLGLQVRLPTEAQWEYACRAGTTGPYAGPLDSMAWYDEHLRAGSTHPVAQKQANAWGLYDMHGNVWEWCSDYWGDKFYVDSPTSDPENTTPDSSRIFRGGCWYMNAGGCRSAERGGANPHDRSAGVGFRVLLVPGPEN